MVVEQAPSACGSGYVLEGENPVPLLPSRALPHIPHPFLIFFKPVWCVVYMHVCLGTTCHFNAYGTLKRESDPLKLELQVFVSCHMGAGYWSRVFWKRLLTTVPLSLQPQISSFNTLAKVGGDLWSRWQQFPDSLWVYEEMTWKSESTFSGYGAGLWSQHLKGRGRSGLHS